MSFSLVSVCVCVCVSAVLWVFQVPLARSEGHLLELMEKVCDRMKDYGETLDPATDRKTYVRFTARQGSAAEVSNVSYDSRVTSDLKFAVRIRVYNHNALVLTEYLQSVLFLMS